MRKINSILKILTVGILSSMVLCSCNFYEILEQLFQQIYFDNTSFTYTDNGYQLVETPRETISIKRDDDSLAGHSISMLDIKTTEDYEVFPSIGDQKLLVIPVYFSDYPVESCIGDKDASLENINKLYFGEASETGWESLSSFYTKSSYGKLNVTGMVTSWCPINKTLLEVAKMTQYEEPSQYCLRTAIDWFKRTYPDEVKNFDLDNDGYIDGVNLVYANTYYSNSTVKTYSSKYNSKDLQAIKDFLWAYTFWDYKQPANKISPVANAYTWLSYNFMWEGNYLKPAKPGDIFGQRERLVDAHTYIHEFGHLMGLDDYYSYDDDDNCSPAGKLDMMDYNIGDHTAYSKYALGWYEPILVTNEGTYNLDSLAESGNALLIPASLEKFSYSAFDEYLLIDLYTPTGLNKSDADSQYCGTTSTYPKMFTKPGFRITHVDSRLAIVNAQKQYYYTYTNNSIDKFHLQQLAHSNTPSYSLNPYYKLVNLLSSTGINNYFNNSTASNKDLFTMGDVLDKFTFNNDKELTYKIEVTSVVSSTRKGTIEISRIEENNESSNDVTTSNV